MIVWVEDIGFTQSPLALEFGNYWGGKEGRSSSAAASVAFWGNPFDPGYGGGGSCLVS